MTYLLVLTFVVGVGVKDMEHVCPDAGCVIEAVTHAHESPALARLRVFQNIPPVRYGQSVFPAMIDERYQ